MIQIRLPSITGKTEAEQLQQIKNYLFCLAQELNFVFAALEEKK